MKNKLTKLLTNVFKFTDSVNITNDDLYFVDRNRSIYVKLKNDLELSDFGLYQKVNSLLNTLKLFDDLTLDVHKTHMVIKGDKFLSEFYFSDFDKTEQESTNNYGIQRLKEQFEKSKNAKNILNFKLSKDDLKNIIKASNLIDNCSLELSYNHFLELKIKGAGLLNVERNNFSFKFEADSLRKFEVEVPFNLISKFDTDVNISLYYNENADAYRAIISNDEIETMAACIKL